MKSKILSRLKKSFFIVFFLLLSIALFAQTTFKVVCDKTDNTVKVVESENRSPNYVPIKGGFPFRQVAQKWIDENYSTTTCNPGEIIKQNKLQEKSTAPSPNNVANNLTQSSRTPAPSPSPTPLQPRRTNLNSSNQFKNTSFIVNAKLSNLGTAFSSEKKLTPGLNVGIEQLFGQKTYLGIGAYLDIYFAEFTPANSFDKMTFFFGKIPVYFGQRIYKKNLLIMYEAGAEFNTKIIADDEDFEIPGKTFKSNSFDLTARVRIGTEKIQLTLGTEMWVSEIFENDSFKMTSVYLGLRFNF